MTAPAAPTNTLRLTAEQTTPEAAQERAKRAKRRAVAGRKVVELGREKLAAIALSLEDVPTDMPHSHDVKEAYEAAFAHMRHNEWAEAREQLFELGVMALGWAARIDVAETREEMASKPAPAPAPPAPKPAKGAPRICESCSAEFHLTRPGRPPKRCPECRA